jgi:hypothetical protein
VFVDSETFDAQSVMAKQQHILHHSKPCGGVFLKAHLYRTYSHVDTLVVTGLRMNL